MAPKTVARIAILIVIILMAATGGCSSWMRWKLCGPNNRIHKYLLPGEYSTFLQPGEYGAWFFTTWKSKNVESPSAQLEVSIKGPPDGFIFERKPGDFGEISYPPERSGKLEFYFRIDKAGTYRISGKDSQRLVFVIVPENERRFDLGNMVTFDGADGDYNFEKETKREPGSTHN